ncbi:hypothetical protein EJ06DRAFT_522437 [Trichodelitschia bisporula]|uniref:Cell wall mannoprotein PIR1-like C-terminal domain-containing protein n=1 Tax=Trichodelitschia bisporula TaxID=703511 RepID=A0A6G1HUF6_9PEZI|nr:hypothetical protein EJ06DRAFT_522437 [Trichodelitschia bisporula]
MHLLDPRLLSLAALAAAQGVTQAIPPPGGTPSECSSSHDGTFPLAVVSASNGQPHQKRQQQQKDTLTCTLRDGKLLDSQGRTGYIASNYQFQFDNPPQTGALYTTGFTLCPNGTLGLGPTTTFYQCLSGDFYNLYDRSWAPQCVPIKIVNGSPQPAPPPPPAVVAVDGASSAPTVVAVLEPTGSGGGVAAGAVPVSERMDGQVGASMNPGTDAAPAPTPPPEVIDVIPVPAATETTTDTNIAAILAETGLPATTAIRASAGAGNGTQGGAGRIWVIGLGLHEASVLLSGLC